MKVHLHFSEVSRSALPLKSVQIQKLFRAFVREMSQEPEWLKTVETLGAKPSSLGILFCDDELMRDYQRRFRKLDRTTDILSFPTIEAMGPEQGFEDEDSRSLGDLIVSLPAIERGAKRGRRTAAAELGEVLIHGGLHLLGMDHVLKKGVGPAQARRMRKLQRELFQSLRPIIVPES